jgi:hypothetical protein
MFVIIGEKSKAASSLSDDLCLTCHNFQEIRYSLNESAERVCHYNGQKSPLKGPVSSCSMYADRNHPSKWEMEQIAWTIEASKKKVGFGAEMDITINPPKKKRASVIDND